MDINLTVTADKLWLKLETFIFCKAALQLFLSWKALHKYIWIERINDAPAVACSSETHASDESEQK